MNGDLPDWMQWVGGLAAVGAVAEGVRQFYRRVVRHLVRFLYVFERALPMLEAIIVIFGDEGDFAEHVAEVDELGLRMTAVEGHEADEHPPEEHT